MKNIISFEEFSINEKKKSKKVDKINTLELTPKQKKLPVALQASILKKMMDEPKKGAKENENNLKNIKTELTPKQKKLPLALQASILKRMKK